ncbi:MAG: DUF3223 domain-containing protein [archaeon]|nr:DUF3223 domain-containing protein [archaeon]
MEKNPSLSEEELNNIKNQLEYYLSDDNLKRDEFFHKTISENPDGYLDLTLILKCNKIIKAKWTKENLIEGAKLSSEIELDATCDKIRRKGNRELPELILLKKKRKNEEEDKDEEEKEVEEERVIIAISSKEEVETSWKKIEEKFKEENKALNVIYCRFKKKEGHIAILTKAKEEIKFTPSLEVEGHSFEFKLCEGDALIDFYKDHYNHLESCLKALEKTKKNKKDKNKSSKKEKNHQLKEPLKLGGSTFNDISSIRNKVREILADTKDGVALKQKQQLIIMDILKYHHNYEEKVKDMDFITCGKSPEFPQSRCFFIQKKNGDKVDFSIKKCIDELVQKEKKD